MRIEQMPTSPTNAATLLRKMKDRYHNARVETARLLQQKLLTVDDATDMAATTTMRSSFAHSILSRSFSPSRSVRPVLAPSQSISHLIYRRYSIHCDVYSHNPTGYNKASSRAITVVPKFLLHAELYYITTLLVISNICCGANQPELT